MIEIGIAGRVQEAIAELARRCDDLSPAMRGISGVMADAVEQNFEEQGRPRWEDLAQSTKAQRAKSGHWPGRILQVSGYLASSIQRESGKDYAVAGTNTVYAAIQHFGGQAGRNLSVEIPARPFMELGADDEDEILGILARYLGNDLASH